MIVRETKTSDRSSSNSSDSEGDIRHQTEAAVTAVIVRETSDRSSSNSSDSEGDIRHQTEAAVIVRETSD